MSKDELRKLDDDNLDAVAGGRMSDEWAARAVLEGKFGDEPERSRRLRAAGYNPYSVQSIVNQMVKGSYRDPYQNPGDWNPGSYVDPYK